MCVLTLQISHRPDRKIADVLASTLACTTTADASVNYRMQVPQILENFSSPHGRLTFCSLLAGRWCRCRVWLISDHLIVHHQWEHSWPCARSSSKVPNNPMGDSRFARCLQGGGVAVRGGTVLIVNSQVYSNQATSVRAHAQEFPFAPQWENC